MVAEISFVAVRFLYRHSSRTEYIIRTVISHANTGEYFIKYLNLEKIKNYILHK